MEFRSAPVSGIGNRRSRRPGTHSDPVVAAQSERGPGLPNLGYLVRAASLIAFLAGGVLVVSFTKGIGSVEDFSSWWTDPVVYQKFVVWALLWDFIGLGAAHPPTFGFRAPTRAVRLWLRAGTIRLPPWPTRVPLTAGNRRTTVDVAVYVAVFGISCWLLGPAGSAGETLPAAGVWALLGTLALLGLRDTTTFLSARPERYAVMLIVFLLPTGDLVLALKLVLVALWWGVATSRLTRQFPYAVSAMVSNVAWARSAQITPRLWRDVTDRRPSITVSTIAHASTGLLYVLPLVLLLSSGGAVTTVAVTAMVVLQVLAVLTFPFGVTLEGTAFLIYSTVFLFGHYADQGVESADTPMLAMLPAALLITVVLFAGFAPGHLCLPSSIRSGSGNEPSTFWLVEKSVAEDFDAEVGGLGDDSERRRALAYRSAHAPGRALTGLRGRAVEDPTRYTVHDGVLVSYAATGSTIGSGHAHDEHLLAAVQEHCDFAPGQVRLISLDPQAIHRAEQRYRIVDVADGLVEEGLLDVDDIVKRRPWRTAEAAPIPVEVVFNRSGFAGYTTPADFAFLADRDLEHWHGLEDESELPAVEPPAVAPEPSPASAPRTLAPRLGGATSPLPSPSRPVPRPSSRPALPRSAAPRPAVSRPVPTRVVSGAAVNPVDAIPSQSPSLADTLATANGHTVAVENATGQVAIERQVTAIDQRASVRANPGRHAKRPSPAPRAADSSHY